MIDIDSSTDNANVCNNLKLYIAEVFAAAFRKQIDVIVVLGSAENEFQLNQFVCNTDIMVLYVVYDQSLGNMGYSTSCLLVLK